MTENYNEDSIEVLKGLEGVRKRPSMYIGSLDNGIWHILKEALDNSLDEATSGFSKRIGCIIKDNEFTVFDEGRGIPVGPHKTDPKKSTLEIVMTQLHAGGKLKDGAYSSGSTGVHGVGISCTNALSLKFEVYTYRDKKWYYQSYSKGIPTSKVINKKPNINLKKGTIIKFTPDDSILKNKINIKSVTEWFKNSAFLNENIEFYLNYNGKEKTLKSKGLSDYIKYITKDLNCDPLYKPFLIKTENVDLVLQWFEDDSSSLNSWCNTSPTIEGGTHVNGLIKIINKSFDSFVKKKSYKPEDLRIGLYGAINIRITQPQFDSQTKEKLISKNAEELVISQVENEFIKYLNSNKSFVKKVISRAEEIRGIYNKFTQEKKALSKLKTRGKSMLPPASKFISSNCKDDSLRELYIVEGESAGGSARSARNPFNQEVLKLKGKILNIAKTSLSKAYESEDILNILKAIGFNPDTHEHPLRIGKIIILTDADEDGGHISILLLTLIQKLYPKLLDEGRVFTVDAPLFVGKTATKEYYGETLEKLRESYPGKFISVSRIKGWGELDASLLRKLAFDPNTRKLYKITCVTDKKLKYFYKIVGDDTETRKQLLFSA